MDRAGLHRASPRSASPFNQEGRGRTGTVLCAWLARQESSKRNRRSGGSMNCAVGRIDAARMFLGVPFCVRSFQKVTGPVCRGYRPVPAVPLPCADLALTPPISRIITKTKKSRPVSPLAVSMRAARKTLSRVSTAPFCSRPARDPAAPPCSRPRFRYPGIEALGSIVLDGSGTRKSSLARKE